MKNCKDISELLSDSLDRKLTWPERLEIRLHFMMCRSCPKFLQQINFLRKTARRYIPKS